MKSRQLKTTKINIQGFTLMELMLVIAILGILTAIAYPSYKRHIQTTNRKATIAEMHIISQALARFYTNHNGTYDDGVEPKNKNANIDKLVNVINARIEGYIISVAIDDTDKNFGQAYTITATQKDSMGDPNCGNLNIDNYGGKTSTQGTHCFR